MMLLEALEISNDGILNILERLLTSLSLRKTPRESRTFSDKDAIFILLNQDPI